jgi:hypothetical protein
MPRVKILKQYENSDHWIPGQIVDASNPWSLIKERKAVLVNDEGAEIEEMDVLIQVRSLVTSKEMIDFVGRVISKHPRKEEIIKSLSDSGVITLINEEVAKTPFVEAKIETPIEVVERPTPIVTEAEVLAKVQELRKKAEDKKKGTE